MLPYLWALAAWRVLAMALYIATIRGILPARATVLAAVLSPGTFIAIVHGQNGLVLGAIIGGGLLLLPHAPLTAGCLLGLTSMKPHLG